MVLGFSDLVAHFPNAIGVCSLDPSRVIITCVRLSSSGSIESKIPVCVLVNLNKDPEKERAEFMRKINSKQPPVVICPCLSVVTHPLPASTYPPSTTCRHMSLSIRHHSSPSYPNICHCSFPFLPQPIHWHSFPFCPCQSTINHLSSSVPSYLSAVISFLPPPIHSQSSPSCPALSNFNHPPPFPWYFHACPPSLVLLQSPQQIRSHLSPSYFLLACCPLPSPHLSSVPVLSGP